MKEQGYLLKTESAFMPIRHPITDDGMFSVHFDAHASVIENGEKTNTTLF